MKALILAGGGGTRLWPLSRKSYPKQFLRLTGSKSLLQQTVERFLNVVPIEDLLIITNRDYRFYVLSDMSELSDNFSPEQTLLEPLSRNTAPAIALALKHCIERLNCKGDEVILVSPSDHIVKPEKAFTECIECAYELAKAGRIVTFGLRPSRPETGYGYIKAGAQNAIIQGKEFPEVESFVEKPDIDTATDFIKSGQYFWNSGMFAFMIDTMIEEIKNHNPEISSLMELEYDSMIKGFSDMPSISIDYAVIERSKKVSLVPMDLQWSDIGSWDAIYEALDKDSMGNALVGDIQTIDTRQSLIISKNRHIAAIGMEECLIVETPDSILVSKRGESQKVKDAVCFLKENKRTETEEHTTSFRPWGSFTVLEVGQRYKIKRIVVLPKERLSLQMHHHRSEHWVVVSGTGRVTIGDKEFFVHDNESVYVPKTTLHRLENPGKVPLEIIEVQNGDYVGEDDIVRFQDNYERLET